jgi:LacI family repressor for deo operon, udp, cdd, tsx, nupC, and nupG
MRGNPVAYMMARRIGPSVPNIYEVAKRAGVSPSTVSRVLSQPDVVSAKTRSRVLRAVDVLGYTPNSTAKNLRTARTGKLLVTVPDISNPFFSLILQGIEDAAQREEYAVLLGDTQHDEQREQRYATMLSSKEADGLIFLGHRLPEAARVRIRQAAPRCAPVVNGCEFNPRVGVPSVHIDNARAAADAMTLLYDFGHRRIGVVTGPLASPLSRDRLRGASAVATERGGDDLSVVGGDFTIESGSQAAARLFASAARPTAIFCFNDEMAMGVLDYARRAGLGVPADLSVVGFDDIRFARYTEPALTTIAQPMREIGEGTVRLLLAILADDTVTPASVTLPHRLVLRETAGPVRTSR